MMIHTSFARSNSAEIFPSSRRNKRKKKPSKPSSSSSPHLPRNYSFVFQRYSFFLSSLLPSFLSLHVVVVVVRPQRRHLRDFSSRILFFFFLFSPREQPSNDFYSHRRRTGNARANTNIFIHTHTHETFGGHRWRFFSEHASTASDWSRQPETDPFLYEF